MILFSGICQNGTCGFIWRIEGRAPNFCPECGHRVTTNSATKEEIEIVDVESYTED